MAERQRAKPRPVEFRGLSTHYVQGEDITATFRYPAASFQPHESDKVKLYARGARAGDKSIASALVGDGRKHKLCDGGLYKTGSVVIPTATVSELATAERTYVLFYGSGRMKSVVGKSQPFIICPQSEYPSIQIRSLEDNVLIDKLRAHSPIGSGQPMFPAGGRRAAVDESSFVMVADSLLEGWESSEEEDMEDEEGEEGEGEGWSGAWEDIGQNVERVHSREGSVSSSYQSSTEDSDDESQNLLSQSDDEVADPLPRVPATTQGRGVNLGPSANGIVLYNQESGTVTRTPQLVPVATTRESQNTTNAIPSKASTKSVVGAGKSESNLNLHEGKPTPALRNTATTPQQVPDHLSHNSSSSNSRPESNGFQNSPVTPPPRPKQLPLVEETLLRGVDLSESIVIVEEMSQQQVLMIKSANKELRTKLRIIHDKLQGVTKERDSLVAVQGELEGRVSVLVGENKDLKQKNHKLGKDKASLQGKVKQLETEVSSLSKHCGKQVDKMNQYETRLKIVCGQKEELERRVHHLEKKLKRHESDHHHRPRHDHQKYKATQGGSCGGVGDRRVAEHREKVKRAHSQSAHPKKTEAVPYRGLMQRPVIEVYVSDPVERRGGERGERKREERKGEREEVEWEAKSGQGNKKEQHNVIQPAKLPGERVVRKKNGAEVTHSKSAPKEPKHHREQQTVAPPKHSEKKQHTRPSGKCV